MNQVVALRDAGPGAGGKATGLARLVGAGLAVPDGFVITHAAFVEVAGELPDIGPDPAAVFAAIAARAETATIPGWLAGDVLARARALGGKLAVRSSVSIEDAATGAAAGVLSSQLGVDPDAVWPAIRAVWASACTPLVVHYARRQGVARIEIGVIVQRFVAGERITVYTRPPDAPTADAVWIERERGRTTRPRSAAEPVVRAAIAAEAAIGATATGADVELVAHGGGVAVVQARPIVPTARAQCVAPPPAILAALVGDGKRTWRWDVEHNPEPLSVAQAALVAAVDEARVAPWRMCTVAGYLYIAEDQAPPPMVTGPASARLLEERFAMLAAKMSAAIAEAGTEPSVDEAVGAYVAFYRVWAGEVAPMLATARAGAMSRAAAGKGGGSPIARAIAETARGDKTRSALLREIGDLAMAWDVASPTLAERPELIDAAIAAAKDVPAREEESQRKSMAVMAMELSETDDLWFARAQAMVRRALLAAGDRMGIGDDVFWLPLEELDGEIDPAAAHARASAARTAAERAKAWDMPRLVGGDSSTRSSTSTSTSTKPSEWRGVGGGRGVGKVKKLVGATVVTPGTVVVARAITPAIALLVGGAAALISETGGILAHGAAIARELGIPFVVGCDGVWDGLDDGDQVEIDGEAGVVRRLSARDA